MQCLQLPTPSTLLIRFAQLLPWSTQSTHPERCQSFNYYTQQTEASPLAKYLRQDDENREQVVLDINQVQTNTSFVSIGQVKLSTNEQLVAYTIDVGNGNEAYEARVQSIGGMGFIATCAMTSSSNLFVFNLPCADR